MTTSSRVVVALGAAPDFAEGVRSHLAGERVLAARTVDEAASLVAGGGVDLVLVDPSSTADGPLAAARAMRRADPTTIVALAADTVTDRLILTATQAGVADVVELPLTSDRLAALTESRWANGAAEDEVGAIVLDHAEELVAVSVGYEAASESATPATFTSFDVGAAAQLAFPSAPDDAAAIRPDHAWADPVAMSFIGDAPRLSEDPRIAGVPAEELPAGPAAADRVVEATDVAPALDLPSGPDAADQAMEEEPDRFEAPMWLDPRAETAEPTSADVPSVSDSEVPADLDHDLPPAFSHFHDGGVEPEDTPVEPLASAGEEMTFEVMPALPTGPQRPIASPVDLEEIGLLPAHGAQPSDTPAPGAVIAVMAGKGGSGKTITATNLAVALTLEHGEGRVVLVDADNQFGDVAAILGLEPSHTLADAAARLDAMTDDRFDGLLLDHASGLHVLAAPPRPTSADAMPAKAVAEVIEQLATTFEFVVVDTAPVFDDNLITVLECADQVLVVVDMDVPSVKNARIALGALRDAGFPMDRLRLVVNRADAKARLDVGELEESVGLRLHASIPSDRLVPESVNGGVPVVTSKPRSRVAKAFRTLARTFTPGSDAA